LYFWDGWQTVEETTSAGVLSKQFVWGEGIDECVKANLPDAAYIDGDSNTAEKVDLYYHHNSLGSVVAVSDLNGVVKESYRYSAFGQPTIFDKNGGQVAATQVKQPFMFTGARHDFEEGSGLYQMRLRYYDPESGRFVSRDPLGLWGDASQNGNGQGYCGHDPVNRVDPLGDWSPTFEIGPTASDGQGGVGSTGVSGDGRNRFTEEDWAARDKRAMELGWYGLGLLSTLNPWTAGVWIVLTVGSEVENCQDPDWEVAVAGAVAGTAGSGLAKSGLADDAAKAAGSGLADDAARGGTRTREPGGDPFGPGGGWGGEPRPGRKIYRGLAEGEDPSKGLTARKPNAGNSPESHVAGKKETQWISGSKNPVSLPP